MKLEEVADGVYACLADDTVSGESSSSLVSAGGGLVIDTQIDLTHAQRMIELFGRVWRRPPGFVVNTHGHPGHTGGNALFPGAEMCGVRSSWSGPLDRTRLDGASVHLVPVGACHSDRDTLVYLPNERVLCAGDVVCRDLTPLVTGSFTNWLSVLDWIIELDPEVIVPGHGPLCGIEGAMDAKVYLAHIWIESKRHFREGRTAAEAARRIDLGAFAAWSEPARLHANVAQAYRELRHPQTSPQPSAGLEPLRKLSRSWNIGLEKE